MARSTHHPLSRVAVAAALVTFASHPASAQTLTPSSSEPTTELQPVTVTGRSSVLPATIGGWGDTPLAKTPMQASVFTAEQLKDQGVQRLSDLIAVDPGVTDAYNSEGYWDFLTVRGYVLDNQFNFRRDGLPINAETSIPLDNKAAVEILKGTSGMQAGTSAPGGLVNYVVKRPIDSPLRSVFLEWRQAGSITAAADISQRFGVDQAFGVRINAAAAHLDPLIRSSKGERSLFSLAADWRLSPDTLLETEVETSHRSQPSQPGFSMLGNTVPSPGDPRINLNNQPWSLPVVFNATTASLRLQQKLGDDWRLIAHAATQRLRSDDRLAFPFGCSKEANFDRYCSDGTFDLYDFRSDNERRTTNALDLHAEGKIDTAGIKHRMTFGVLSSRFRSRLQPRVDDGMIVGTGSVDGQTVVPTLPALDQVSNTNLTDRSTEFYARDAITISDRLGAWIGLRNTHLTRESVRTDGTEPTRYTQSFTTPWLALSYALTPDQLVYVSWGRGTESAVVPNRDTYSNAGQALPALKSLQSEIGIKGATEAFEWGLALFDIQQPQFADAGACDSTATCTRQIDGTDHHRGVEATAAWHLGAWSLRGGAQWLHARREGSQTLSINGLEPTNVPTRTLRLQASYDVPYLPGLAVQARLSYESRRFVLPDNSASIPGYSRVDAGLRYGMRLADAQWTWRAGVDNLFDKRAWRESPFEFNHVYLYPLAPRTFHVSAQVDF